MIATACFLGKTEKLPYVRTAIRKIDTIKVLLQLLWEMKSLKIKEYIALSEELDPVGRMLGGWSGQLVKQNSPVKTGEKWRELRDDEREAIVAIPPVLGIIIVRVQPPAIAVAVRGKEFRIAIGIARNAVYTTAPWIFLELNLIRHRNAITLRAKYLRFLKFSYTTLSESADRRTRIFSMQGYWIRRREYAYWRTPEYSPITKISITFSKRNSPVRSNLSVVNGAKG